jgi:hypothetical protein
VGYSYYNPFYLYPLIIAKKQVALLFNELGSFESLAIRFADQFNSMRKSKVEFILLFN